MANVVYQQNAGFLYIGTKEIPLSEAVMDYTLNSITNKYQISIRSAGGNYAWLSNCPLDEIEDNLNGTYVNIAAWKAWWDALDKGTAAGGGTVTATVTGVSTADNQTNGDQLSQIVDENGNRVHFSGEPIIIVATQTRPADTTTYTAGDAVLHAAAAVKQKETVSLQGDNGTINIIGTGGLTKLVTFAAGGTQDLTQTAADFVTSHAAAYSGVGITVTSLAADIIFEASVAGVPFVAPTAGTGTGNLVFTVDHTTANLTLVPITLPSVAKESGGGVFLMDLEIETDATQFASTTQRFWIFNDTPASIVGDNVAYINNWSNSVKRLTYVDVVFDALLAGSDCVIGKAQPMIELVCGATTNLYVLQQTLTGVTTPKSAGVFRYKFNIIQL